MPEWDQKKEGRNGGGGQMLPPGGNDAKIIAKKLRDRQTAFKIRSELKAQVGKAAKAAELGGNLFQMMARGDDEKALQHELEPDVAGKIKDKVLDKIEEKLKSGLVAISGVGEHVAKHASTVFGVIKGAVDKRIKTEGKLTVLKLVDAIAAGVVDKSMEVEEALTTAVDKLSQDQILAVGKQLDAAEKEGDAAPDQDNSPERGDLGQGMREQAMSEIIGLPRGDLVAAEDVAMLAYNEFKASVRGVGTAAEQVDGAQHAIAHPGETKDKLAGAEEKMGPEFQKNLEKDKTLRARTAEVRS